MSISREAREWFIKKKALDAYSLSDSIRFWREAIEAGLMDWHGGITDAGRDYLAEDKGEDKIVGKGKVVKAKGRYGYYIDGNGIIQAKLYDVSSLEGEEVEVIIRRVS